jgi:hypothetical protein
VTAAAAVRITSAGTPANDRIASSKLDAAVTHEAQIVGHDPRSPTPTGTTVPHNLLIPTHQPPDGLESLSWRSFPTTYPPIAPRPAPQPSWP